MANPNPSTIKQPTVGQRLAPREKPPGGPASLLQRWSHLLFLHWTFPVDTIQQTLPEGLYVDAWEDQAWVAMVPFFMRDVHPRGFPTLPRVSDFLELNLRTYVHDADGNPAVWFYTLEANQRLAVEVARRFFHLPYHYAGMGAFLEEERQRVSYLHRRPDETLSRRVIYGPEPGGEYRRAAEGSLEYFLLERYQFFSRDEEGQFYSGRVHHDPYEFTDAQVTRCDSGLFSLNHLPEPSEPPRHTCYVRDLNVQAWKVRPVNLPARKQVESQ
jgi:hypothetical protein